MSVTLDAVCGAAGRGAGELTRRDVARSLLATPAAEARAALPELRRGLAAAGNPLSRLFWDRAETLLAAIAEGTATVGDVRRWLEATGTEPTAFVAGGFLWPDEDERGPVAREMHAQLVAHLEGLVARGVIDPDRLLAGDDEALSEYEEAQVAWLYRPLPDGRQPIWAVSDEEDEEFLAAWEDAEADARQILSQLLPDIGSLPPPEEELQASCARLRQGLADGHWPYDLLAAAGGVGPDPLPTDDRELWLMLATGVVTPRDEPPQHDPYDSAAHASWLALDHPAWIGAVVGIVREGPGARADAAALAHHAATFDFEEVDVDDADVDDADVDDADFEDADFEVADLDEAELEELEEFGLEVAGPWLDDDDGPWLDDENGPWIDDLEADELDDELPLSAGFATVELLWRTLGAVDQDTRLTALGWWGLPEALRRAWTPPE